jgi:hypothetical protein
MTNDGLDKMGNEVVVATPRRKSRYMFRDIAEGG